MLGSCTYHFYQFRLQNILYIDKKTDKTRILIYDNLFEFVQENRSKWVLPIYFALLRIVQRPIDLAKTESVEYKHNVFKICTGLFIVVR